jgi:hypothetical protein
MRVSALPHPSVMTSRVLRSAYTSSRLLTLAHVHVPATTCATPRAGVVRACVLCHDCVFVLYLIVPISLFSCLWLSPSIYFKPSVFCSTTESHPFIFCILASALLSRRATHRTAPKSPASHRLSVLIGFSLVDDLLPVSTCTFPSPALLAYNTDAHAFEFTFLEFCYHMRWG